MKRELPTEGAAPGRDSSRRCKVRRGADTRIRDEDEVLAGELDLNATPRGFDLNAPVVEEEDSAELSVWQSEPFVSRGPPIALPSQPVPGDPTRPGDAALVCAVQVTESVDLTDEAEKNSACTVNDTAKGDVIEDASKAGSACPLKLAACIAIPVEISSSLGVDEDLDIIHAAWAAVQQGNMLALDNILTDACEELAKNSQSLSKYHLLSCLYISKKIPEAFRLPGTYQKLRSLLSYGKGQPAQKRQNLLPVLACKLLQRAFSSEAEWPVDFVEHYLEDAIGARAWIENDGCKEFVLNVLSAFPDPVMDGPGVLEEPIRQDHQGPTEPGHGPASQCPVRNRYPGDEIREHVRTEFHNALNQLLATNATKENPRMLLRLLVQGAGYEEVRVMASSMLESWLNNPVHVRIAKSLLDRIVKHTHATSENDFNTVANLLALRVTSLQVPGQMKALHGSIFADMVSQLVRRRSEYATLALKTFVTAEINNKNPHNVKSIATVLKAMPDSPPPEQELASILQELAAHEDSRPHLRDLVRRIMKQAISDINVHALCHGLMQPWPAMEEQSDHVKESWLKQIVDLVCQLLLHAVAPYATDEGLVTAVNLLPTATGSGVYPSGSGYSLLKEKLSVMEKFSIETANLQEDAMAWCTDVLAVYLPQIQESDFLQIVQQLLFLKGPDIYAINSENPGDLDMLCYKLLTFCLRAPEEILARLILMGISNYPLTQAKAMDIIEGLVWRAAKLQNYMVGALTAKSDQLPAAIFKLSSANLSPNTRLQFVLKDLYWRAAIVVLTIAVCNPTTIGQFVWLNCPTIRVIMEVILTGRRKVASPCGDGVDKFEADRLELEAIQRDVKAEEAISAFYAAQAASELVTPVPWPFQGEEWRGNVMVFNPGGPTRQPPITVLEDLRHIDDVYHLGSMLRKCRSPNFFSEITSSQTLRHAWPWLESVIVSDPDVMVVLPCLWQCELLYMHEASSTKSELQTLNLSDVKWNLQKILTEGSHLNDVDEVNIIVSFFAMKLASRNSATRYCARCCLTRLLTGDCEAAVTDFARTAIPENGGSAGGTIDPDSCEWLEMLDGAATKFLVIEALVPSLQLAIQIESNIHVVASYLDFLQKHMACLPPSSTLAFCVSFLVVYRKSLAASLLATVSDGPERTGQKKFNVANFMLQTVLTAIQLGTGHDQGWSRFQDVEAPVVGLVTPRASTVTRVEVHKMVVDAALQLLAWFANNVLDATKQAMYDELLELLLPGFTHFSKTFHDNRMVAWLETSGGQKFSLLSEAQATSFARTKDARVHSAALSFLSLEAKLDILAELGLSASAGTALLEEFDGLSETRLSMVLALKGVTLQRAKKICGSVISLQHSGSHGGSGFLRMLERHISAFVHYQSDVQFAPHTENDNTFMEHEVLRPLKAIHGRHLSEEELFTHVSGQFSSQTVTTDRSNILEHERKAKTHIGFNYMSFRKQLAICLILADFEDINKFLESMMESLAHARGRRVPAMTSIALSLPILSSLWHCGLEEHLDTATAPEGCKSRLRLPDITEVRALFLAVLSLLHSWLNKVPGAGNPTIRTRELCSLVRALFIIDGFKDCSRRHSVSWRTRHLHSNLRARLKSSGSQKLPPSLLVGGPIQNLEAELIALFCLTVSPAMVSGSVALGMGKDTDQDNSENIKESVITELGNLMKHWEGVSFASPFQKTEEYDRLEQKQVELCGRLGLVVELLLFIDPDLQSECHMSSLSSLHAPNHVTGHDLVRRELEAPSHARIALEGMFHQGSWITISRIVGAILSYQNETQGCLEQVPTAKGGNPGLTDSEAYMEFLDCCSYHPHAQLECRTSSESNFMSAIGLNFITASLQPSSARALVRLAVVDCSIVNILMQNNVTNNRHVSDHRLHFYSRLNRGLRLIMFFASKELELIAAMLQELVNLQEGTAEEILAGLNLVPPRQDAMTKAVRVAANYLVWGLYSAFPITVTSICEFGSEKESPNGHHAGSCPPEWVSRLDLVLHNSLTLIFSGDERESNAAFDFLHEFSRQHPLLIAPHLPMLALHLKNMLPLVKQVDNQARSTAARTLAFGIELLDSLRPSVLEEKKMDSYVRTGACCESVRSSKSDVDIILSLYFEFLQDLDVQDRPHFAKVVARVADFLCHCVAAGGRYRQLVMSHHKPLLQTAAHTFGKIKKLGYLLTLLDSASCTDSVEDPLFQDQDEKTTPLGARTGPALPVEDVLKVKKQILQFLRWQTPHEREGANHCGPGKELHYSPRDVHGFHMEEIEDVNIDAALSDLEQASARMPTLLPLLQDSLLELSKVSNVNIRDKAFSLLQRQLLHCPSKESATKIVLNLQEQLASSQVALAKSAARQVSSFFHCCPEFQEVLLVEMLKLGRPVADDLQQLIQRLFTIVGGM